MDKPSKFIYPTVSKANLFAIFAFLISDRIL